MGQRVRKRGGTRGESWPRPPQKISNNAAQVGTAAILMSSSETNTTTRRRVGIFGGSFDPVHVGHLWIAEAAAEQLRLDKVRWIPAAESTETEFPNRQRRSTVGDVAVGDRRERTVRGRSA